MKKHLLTTMILLLVILSNGSFAKEALTKTSFKVSGNCDMCKNRIEKAAKTEGVKTAVWNVDTHLLTLTFAPAKISVADIEQNIAKAGYDTDRYKANSSAYGKLPQCCQYER